MAAFSSISTRRAKGRILVSRENRYATSRNIHSILQRERTGRAHRRLSENIETLALAESWPEVPEARCLDSLQARRSAFLARFAAFRRRTEGPLDGRDRTGDRRASIGPRRRICRTANELERLPAR